MYLFGCHPRNLLQFFHQIVFCLQAACGIYDQEVCLATFLAGADGIKDHGSRISPWFMRNDFDTGTLTPNLELIDGSGTKGICRGDQRAASAIFVKMGHLADACRLAST